MFRHAINGCRGARDLRHSYVIPDTHNQSSMPQGGLTLHFSGAKTDLLHMFGGPLLSQLTLACGNNSTSIPKVIGNVKGCILAKSSSHSQIK